MFLISIQETKRSKSCAVHQLQRAKRASLHAKLSLNDVGTTLLETELWKLTYVLKVKSALWFLHCPDANLRWFCDISRSDFSGFTLPKFDLLYRLFWKFPIECLCLMSSHLSQLLLGVMRMNLMTLFLFQRALFFLSPRYFCVRLIV